MVTFIKKADSKKKSIKVLSATPRRKQFKGMNRAQRRALVYGSPVRQMFARILKLRSEMIEIGVNPKPLPNFKNRKCLSGYKSQLIAQVME